jgi:polyisoprenoid-binding protein YceI
VLVLLALVSWHVPSLAQRSRTFVVDPGTSQVRIELGRAGMLSFLGHDHLIEAPLSAGRIEVDDVNLERSQVSLRFRAAALTIVPGSEPAEDIPKVEQRMRGPEVLDVERHESIALTSTSVSGRTDGRGAYELIVRGALEVLGRRHDIVVPVTARVEGDALTAIGTVDLRLRDLGIAPPSVAGVVKVDNRFTVTFTVKGRTLTSDARDAPRCTLSPALRAVP